MDVASRSSGCHLPRGFERLFVQKVSVSIGTSVTLCRLRLAMNARDRRYGLCADRLLNSLTSRTRCRLRPADPAMVTSTEPKPEDFFVSRSGVCVYVACGGQTYRVQFAAPDAHGVVTEGLPQGADEALALARTALLKHRETLSKLFEEVALRRT